MKSIAHLNLVKAYRETVVLGDLNHLMGGRCMGDCKDPMNEILRRLKLQYLRAKLALCRMEKASLVARVESNRATAEERRLAIRRIADLEGEVRAIESAMETLLEGNGHA